MAVLPETAPLDYIPREKWKEVLNTLTMSVDGFRQQWVAQMSGDWTIATGGTVPNYKPKEEPVPAKVIPSKTVTPYASKSAVQRAQFFRVDSYMEDVHNPAILKEIYEELVPKGLNVDTLVGRGISGTLAVSKLAHELGLRYFIIRKDTDNSHSHYPFEGTLGRNWLFVDDMIVSGKTFITSWEAIEGIRENYNFASTFRGVLLYTDKRFIAAESDSIRYYLDKSDELADEEEETAC